MEVELLRCRDMPELASEYLERTLPFHRRLAVRLHLAICDACTAYYSQMRQTIALLRGMKPNPPLAETEERALAAILATRQSPAE